MMFCHSSSFQVRYADWLLTTPLLLLDLGLLVGASNVDIGWIVFCDVIMVVAGFAGVVSTGTNAAWPLFIFGSVPVHRSSASACVLCYFSMSSRL
jgi:bacteriorhodopsin